MRIRTLEDLEDELITKQEKYLSLIDSLTDMFDEENFEKSVEVNGTAFNNKEGSVTASFYVSTNGEYKGYVTNDADNSANYSIKGEEENALKAAENLIDMFNQEVENEMLKDGED